MPRVCVCVCVFAVSSAEIAKFIRVDVKMDRAKYKTIVEEDLLQGSKMKHTVRTHRLQIWFG